MFTALLADFLFRLTFGVALAMAVTSSRLVTSGFFRVHLWMLLGCQTLAALAAYSTIPRIENIDPVPYLSFGVAVAGAVVSYVGAVAWLYERPWIGKFAIVLVALLAKVGCQDFVVLKRPMPWLGELAWWNSWTSGLLLGSVTAAMLLGHWYLNTPTMKIEPLKRLLWLVFAAVALRACICAPSGWLVWATQLSAMDMSATTFALFLTLRWLSGLVGTLILAVLTWQTLKIPNTQSATGILYAAVVLTFIGELTSQLLSAETLYPV